MKKYKIGGQFSGVGAFDQALMRLGIDFENVYQADWDKYGSRIYDRVFDMFNIIEFKGNSFRV